MEILRSEWFIFDLHQMELLRRARASDKQCENKRKKCRRTMESDKRERTGIETEERERVHEQAKRKMQIHTFIYAAHTFQKSWTPNGTAHTPIQIGKTVGETTINEFSIFHSGNGFRLLHLFHLLLLRFFLRFSCVFLIFIFFHFVQTIFLSSNRVPLLHHGKCKQFTFAGVEETVEKAHGSAKQCRIPQSRKTNKWWTFQARSYKWGIKL